MPRPLVCLTVELLFELGRDRRERAVELCPKALHDRDNRDRDASCDQTILNGRRAALISQEGFEFSGHA